MFIFSGSNTYRLLMSNDSLAVGEHLEFSTDNATVAILDDDGSVYTPEPTLKPGVTAAALALERIPGIATAPTFSKSATGFGGSWFAHYALDASNVWRLVGPNERQLVIPASVTVGELMVLSIAITQPESFLSPLTLPGWTTHVGDATTGARDFTSAILTRVCQLGDPGSAITDVGAGGGTPAPLSNQSVWVGTLRTYKNARVNSSDFRVSERHTIDTGGPSDPYPEVADPAIRTPHALIPPSPLQVQFFTVGMYPYPFRLGLAAGGSDAVLSPVARPEPGALGNSRIPPTPILLMASEDFHGSVSGGELTMRPDLDRNPSGTTAHVTMKVMPGGLRSATALIKRVLSPWNPASGLHVLRVLSATGVGDVSVRAGAAADS